MNKRYRNPKGQSRMDNPEMRHRQHWAKDTKQKAQHEKLK
jgi:hypothetical protein